MSGPFLNNAGFGQPIDGQAPTPEAFQPVARGREASPRVMRAYGFLPRRGLRLPCNPSGVDLPSTSIPGVRFATPGYPLPTLRVENACDRDGAGTTDDLETVAAASGVCGSSATCRRFRQVSVSCRKKPVSSTCPTDVSKVGVLEEQSVGREKLFIHPKLMGLLTREPNAFTPYP